MITYTGPDVKIPVKPQIITGPLSDAWDYLANRKGCCKASEFDDDFEPTGPSLRAQLSKHGVLSDTSDGVTIIFFP